MTQGLRFDILNQATGAVKMKAEGSYGSPGENFQRIADYWTSHLRHTGKIGGEEITVADVGAMLILFKLARLSPSPDHRDSYVDIAGYAACAAEAVNDEMP